MFAIMIINSISEHFLCALCVSLLIDKMSEIISSSFLEQPIMFFSKTKIFEKGLEFFGAGYWKIL